MLVGSVVTPNTLGRNEEYPNKGIDTQYSSANQSTPIEKQQQFMEDQEKFNQMVIKKLESPKRIQAHQDESDRKIFAMSSRKK